MTPRRTASAFAACFLLATACGLATSFDEYDTSTVVARFKVRVAVDGLENGATVTLAVNGEPPVVVGNGSVELASLLRDGASYSVTASGPLHMCPTQSGTVKAADVDVHMHCLSSNTTLVSLGLATGTVVQSVPPPYAAGATFRVALPLLTAGATLTAKASSPSAKITVGSAVVPDAGLAIDVARRPLPIEVKVVAASGDAASYVLLVDTTSTYVKASTPRENGYFGGALATSGDTLVVGARGESSGATGVNGDQKDASAPQSGAVYVFRRKAGVWSQEAYLKASNTKTATGFGASVAIDGDTIVVGSPNERSTATGVNGDQTITTASSAGAAYVFVRAAGVWTQQAYVKASNTRNFAYFGTSVAVSGETMAVGATGDSSAATGIDGDQTSTAATSAGAVYVFERAGATWSQKAYVKASNARAISLFGSSMVMAGDTLVVGAAYESSDARGVNGDQASTAAAGAGAAYVFERAAGSWSQKAYLKASNTRPQGAFASSLALSGDALAVGSSGESSNATNVGGDGANASLPEAGAVYVFRRSSGAWAQEAYVKAFEQHGQARFGVVALAGDSLAVGAPNDATTSAQGGAVYTYARVNGAWTPRARLVIPVPRIATYFGVSVALLPDALVVGATGESGDAPGVGGDPTLLRADGAGAVYIH